MDRRLDLDELEKFIMASPHTEAIDWLNLCHAGLYNLLNELESVQSGYIEWKESAIRWNAEQKEIEQQLENLQQERDYHIDQNQALEDTVESLQRDKAALIEVLEWYEDEEIYSPKYDLDEEAVEECWICTPAEMVSDRGQRARTILSQMKGETK